MSWIDKCVTCSTVMRFTRKLALTSVGYAAIGLLDAQDDVVGLGEEVNESVQCLPCAVTAGKRPSKLEESLLRAAVKKLVGGEVVRSAFEKLSGAVCDEW